jgi:hypothetical protein
MTARHLIVHPAYVAGVLDSDGCVLFDRSAPLIRFEQWGNDAFMECLRVRWHAKVYEYPGRPPIASLRGRERVLPFLRWCGPFCLVKQREVGIVLRLLEGEITTDAVMQAQEQLRACKVHRYRHSGPRITTRRTEVVK